jgi:hypothetical protein
MSRHPSSTPAGPRGFRTRRGRVERLISIAVVLLVLPTVPVLAGSPGSLGRSVAPAPAAVPAATAPPTPARSAPAAGPLASSMSWSLLSPGAPWAATGSGFAAEPDPAVGLLFGGATASGLVANSSVYNESADRWSAVAPGRSPSARSDFALAADPTSGIAILFGGLVNLTTNQTTNDTWQFGFGNDSWFNASRPVAPDPREDPAFAVDPSDGIALLYGGWSANPGGTGEITYSDTWELNLGTHVWTRVALGGRSPGPLRGAALLWQPTLDAFLLFGGCYPCSDAVWQFDPSLGSWTQTSASGSVPDPRMNSVWVWDPSVGVDVLFGGTNGSDAFADTAYLDPATFTWTPTSLLPAPGARWDASAGFLNATDNATILLTGGSAGGPPFSDTWRLAAVAALTVELVNESSGVFLPGEPVSINAAVLTTNSTGVVAEASLPATETTISSNIPGFAEKSISLWLAPGSTNSIVLALRPLPPARLVVEVVDPFFDPISGAFVNVTLGHHLLPNCPEVSNSTGSAAFSDVPSGNATIFVTDPSFQNNTSYTYLPPGAHSVVTVMLEPLSILAIHVVGRVPYGDFGLGDVPVLGSDLLLGLTDRVGWLNVTTRLSGPIVFKASAYGFVAEGRTVTVASSGATYVNLTLPAEPFPTIIVEVLGRSAGGLEVLLTDAYVNVTSIGNLPLGAYYGNFTTGRNGTVTLSPPVGNYTFSASAPGYVQNSSGSVLVALSGQQYVRSIYLQPIGFSPLAVLVLSSVAPHPSIGGASVNVTFETKNLTDGLPYPPLLRDTTPVGWANFTGVPAATVSITGSAPGYYSNLSTVVLSYNPKGNSWTIFLTPLPPGAYAGLRILPSGTGSLWVLALVPVAAALGMLVYLTMLRTPSVRRRAEESASERRPPPPAV